MKKKDKREYLTIGEAHVPMIKVFGQYVAFPAGSPKQFWNACVVANKLFRAAEGATKTAKKLEAQLVNIQKLHSQLFPETISSEENRQV